MEGLGPGDEIRFRKAPFTGPLVVAWRDEERRLLWTFEAHVGGSGGGMHLGDDEDLASRKWCRQEGVTMLADDRLIASTVVFYGISMDDDGGPQIQSLQSVSWLESERDEMPPDQLYSHIMLDAGYRTPGVYRYAGRACVHGLLVQEMHGTRRALVPRVLATTLVRLYDISSSHADVDYFANHLLRKFLQPGALVSIGSASRGVVVASPYAPCHRDRADAILHAMATGYASTHALCLTPSTVLALSGTELMVVQNLLSFIVQEEEILTEVCRVFDSDPLQQYRAADRDVTFLDPPKTYAFFEDHTYTVDMELPRLNKSRVTTPTGGRLLVSTSLLETHFVSRGLKRSDLFTSIQPGCRVAWLSEVEPRVRWTKHWGRVVVTTEDNERLLYVVPMEEASDHDTLTAISVDTLTSDPSGTGDASVTLYGIAAYRHVCEIAPTFLPECERSSSAYVNFEDLGPLQAPIVASDHEHAIVDISAYRQRRTSSLRLRGMFIRL